MTWSRRRFMSGAALAAASFLLPGVPGFAAQKDPFAEFDKMESDAFDNYENMVRESFERIDKMTREAFRAAGEELAEDWGKDDALLPSPKEWVGYDEDEKGRVVVDYDKEEIRIEIRVDDGTTPEHDMKWLASLGKKVMEAKPEQLDKLDPVRKRLEEKPKPEPAMTVEQKKLRSVSTLVAEGPPEVAAKEAVKKVEQAIKEKKVEVKKPKDLSGEKIVTVKIPMKKGTKKLNAKLVTPAARAQGERFKIEPALVLAITENESSFNPRAISPVPAYGLMQLVPRTGAADAYAHVYGEQKVVEMEYLFNPENNVELGAAYLHILYYRYLKGVTDPVSRLYCVIAGYNTGAGNVARSFVGSNKTKLMYPVVNKMTPDQVYAHLVKRLPYDETRRYLKKVHKSLLKYRELA